MRRLQVEFDGSVEFTYVMAGIRELPAGPQEAADWLDASAASGMPVDVRGWLADGVRTSYPACMAVKAAAEQGDPGPYLRALREGFALRRARLDHAEAFESVARSRGGLDLSRFRVDLGSNAVMEAFGADLERARSVDVAHHSESRGRVVLPSIEFVGADGARHGVYGPSPLEAYRDAALAVGATPASAGPPSVLDALRRFGTMATAEVSLVCDLPGPRAPAELWRLVSEWQVAVERTLGGEVWTLA
ncbi:MAG: DsbA family protein [Actinomycetota bacterium]|nr:DsbA family protein [Actinomycetota bacterium]